MADSLLLAHTHRLAHRHECKSTSESRRQLLSGVQWRGSAPHRHICPAVYETLRASPQPPTVRLRLPPYVFTNIIFFGIVLLPFVNVAITKHTPVLFCAWPLPRRSDAATFLNCIFLFQCFSCFSRRRKRSQCRSFIIPAWAN